MRLYCDKSLLVILLLIVVACGEQNDKQNHSNSHSFPTIIDQVRNSSLQNTFNFLTFNNGYVGAISFLNTDILNICLTATNSQEDKFIDWIEESVDKWLEPLKNRGADVPNEVNVTSNLNNCHITFRVVAGQWGYTNLTTIPNIVVGPNVPFGVVFHEFGHALGLADTYQSGQSGNCQPGQPQSLMCNISFSELQPDDIEGIVHVYNASYPNEQIPENENNDDLDDSDNESENHGDQIIKMAFEELSNGKVIVHAAVQTLDFQDSSKMKLCFTVEDIDHCEQERNWIYLKQNIEKNNDRTSFFVMDHQIYLSLEDHSKIFLSFEYGSKNIQKNYLVKEVQ